MVNKLKFVNFFFILSSKSLLKIAKIFNWFDILPNINQKSTDCALTLQYIYIYIYTEYRDNVTHESHQVETMECQCTIKWLIRMICDTFCYNCKVNKHTKFTSIDVRFFSIHITESKIKRTNERMDEMWMKKKEKSLKVAINEAKWHANTVHFSFATSIIMYNFACLSFKTC